MRVKAMRDFTLAGEEHAKGEVFEVDEMRGKAWITAKVVEEMPADDPELLTPETRKQIEDAENEDDDTDE